MKSVYKLALLAEAKRRFRLMKEEGLLGTLSPTPIDFINKIVVGNGTTNNVALTSRSIVLELGCGDGRWLNAIRENFKCLCIGIEMDVDRIQLAANSGKKYSKLIPRVDLIIADIFHINFCIATHLIFYLSVEGNIRVNEKIKGEVRPGTIIISCGFQVTDMAPVEVFRSHGMTAYKYIF